MADDRLRFILDFLADSKGLVDAQKKAALLGDSLEESEDAGKMFAAALKAAADKAQKELEETVAMADKLGAALGPELTAKVNVDEIAGKMRAVGMTTAEVEANVDSFRASLDQMASTADQAKARLGDMDDGVRRVGDSTDRSSSVMANFGGNAAQEIPGLTGAFGPLTQAMGEFVEKGLEGEVALKGVAQQVGPMIGLGAAIWYATNQLELMKKKDAFHTERVKAYREVIDKSGDAVGNLADHLRELGKVESSTWGNNANPFADATVDITEKLTKAGFTVEQYAALVEGGAEKIAAWTDAQRAANNEIDGNLVLQIARDSEDYAKAAAIAAENSKFFGKTLRADLYPATRDVSEGFAAAGRAYDALTKKFDTEDAFANAVLALEGLDEKLADIEARMNDKENPISGKEAWAEMVLAVNGATGSVQETLAQMGFLSTALAEKFEVLIETGQVDAAIWKLKWLIELAQAMKADDWFGTNVGRSTPGGTREQTVDGERGGTAPGAGISVTVNAGLGTNGHDVGRQIADVLANHYRSGGARP